MFRVFSLRFLLLLGIQFFCDYVISLTPLRANLLIFFQVYETLEHRLVVAEAAQKLRLPLISDDGEIHEEDIEKWSILSRSSLDSASTTSFTISSASNSVNYANSSANSLGAAPDTDVVGGVPNRFLGITPAYLSYVQLQNTMSMVSSHHFVPCIGLFITITQILIFVSSLMTLLLRIWLTTKCFLPVR